MEINKMLKPAAGMGVLVGAILAVIGSIPIVNVCNIGCCLWIGIGGYFAAKFYAKNSQIQGDEALTVGTIYGATSGIVNTIFTIALGFIMGVLGMGIDAASGNALGPAAAGLGINMAAGLFSGIIFFFISVIFGIVGAFIYQATNK